MSQAKKKALVMLSGAGFGESGHSARVNGPALGTWTNNHHLLLYRPLMTRNP